MLESLPSPLTAFAIWLGFGLLKTAMDIIKKTPFSFFDFTHSLAFGPIALVNEIIQSFASDEALESEAKEIEVEPALEIPSRATPQTEFDLSPRYRLSDSRQFSYQDAEESEKKNSEELEPTLV
ncbi:hypothetical protein VDG1235_1533 [Verrucomicrobiia bacterium DG1235]|nr:hypothetical protein VDG1235_1533 [Verrucomicrobiae bacterium DG1235]